VTSWEGAREMQVKDRAAERRKEKKMERETERD
jgi:hypothetical protein